MKSIWSFSEKYCRKKKEGKESGEVCKGKEEEKKERGSGEGMEGKKKKEREETRIFSPIITVMLTFYQGHSPTCNEDKCNVLDSA